MSSENTNNGGAGLASAEPTWSVVPVCICGAGNPARCRVHGAEEGPEGIPVAAEEEPARTCMCGDPEAPGIVHNIVPEPGRLAPPPCRPAGEGPRPCTCGRPEPGDGVAHRHDGGPCFYLADAVDVEDLDDEEAADEEAAEADTAEELREEGRRLRAVRPRIAELAEVPLVEEAGAEVYRRRLRALDDVIMMTISHEEFDAHEVITLAHYALTGEPLPPYPEVR